MQDCFLVERQICYRRNQFVEGRPTVILIHGHGASLSEWAEYEPAFKASYNLIAVDLKGHGLSHRPLSYGQYDTPICAEDIAQLLSVLGVARCIVVAHSIGSLVALELVVSAWRSKVDGLVLISPIYAYLPFQRFAQIVLIALTPIFYCFSTNGPYKHLDYARFKGQKSSAARRVCAEIKATGVRSYCFWLRRAYERVQDERWSACNLPTLILSGRLDTIATPEHVGELNRVTSSSTLVLFNQADHLLLLNNASEILPQINGFISGIRR